MRNVTGKFGFFLVLGALVLNSCSTPNKTAIGAGAGAVGGAAIGALAGSLFGKVGVGAVIGAAVGGGAGAIIGRKMDKQAEELKKSLPPTAKVERVGEGIIVEMDSKILFAIGKSDLSPASKAGLDNFADNLLKNLDENVKIQGHTDSTGTFEGNMRLSQKRADAVKDYLLSKGISQSRLTSEGLGSKDPIASNSTEEGRAQNRRVSFLITANEKMKAEAQQQSKN